MNNLINTNINIQDKGRFKNTIYFQFSPQEVLNCLEALHIYREYFLPKKYQGLIDYQVNNINEQLAIQGINLYISDEESTFKIGDICYITDSNQQCIIIGASKTENFINVAVFDNEFKILDIPITLLSKEKSYIREED